MFTLIQILHESGAKSVMAGGKHRGIVGKFGEENGVVIYAQADESPCENVYIFRTNHIA